MVSRATSRVGDAEEDGREAAARLTRRGSRVVRRLLPRFFASRQGPSSVTQETRKRSLTSLKRSLSSLSRESLAPPPSREKVSLEECISENKERRQTCRETWVARLWLHLKRSRRVCCPRARTAPPREWCSYADGKRRATWLQ